MIQIRRTVTKDGDGLRHSVRARPEPLKQKEQRDRYERPGVPCGRSGSESGLCALHCAQIAVVGRDADEQRRERRRTGYDEVCMEIVMSGWREHVRIVLPREAVGIRMAATIGLSISK